MDSNKNITNIKYNHLNLPVEITFENNSRKIEYIYDANGEKLRKIIQDNSIEIITDYSGTFLYQNGEFNFYSHPEGYVSKENGEFKYYYNYKDHLGNIRLIYTNGGSVSSSDLQIIAEKNYYPFGLKHKGYNDFKDNTLGSDLANNYEFGGKEFKNDNIDGNSLKLYDFGSRNYDPALGRWFVYDPKAEDMMQVDLSPYNYSWNNPVNVSDPDGECPWCWGAAVGFIVEYGAQVAVNLIDDPDNVGDAFTNINWDKVVLSTATGAATGGLSSVKVVGPVARIYKGIAVSSTAAGGNIAKQRLVDKNKTVNVIEVAGDALLVTWDFKD